MEWIVPEKIPFPFPPPLPHCWQDFLAFLSAQISWIVGTPLQPGFLRPNILTPARITINFLAALNLTYSQENIISFREIIHVIFKSNSLDT